MQHDASAEIANRVDLDAWCGTRHHDNRLGIELSGSHRHPLSMVASGSRDYAPVEPLSTETAHLAVGTAQLE